MNKSSLLVALLELTSHLQIKGLELIENNSYSEIDDFMEDLFSDEEIEREQKETARIYGIVDKDKTMQEIGENQALMIFGDSNEDEE